ncbi:MAG TPA: NAD(P)H-hydrate dehydratase [Firmicutes bacterium]|nr:NAD(P)H-hydrate dehydratase [Bacillota bacterium]
MRVVTGREMRLIEQQALETLGVSGLLLMETAGAGLAALVAEQYGCPAGKKIHVLAGMGNNGGDGLVAARHLLSRGARPKVYLLGDESGATPEHRVNLDILRRLGVELVLADTAHPDRLRFSLSMGDLIIDALLGTGFRGELAPDFQVLVETVNGLQRPVVAVDIPSGVHAATGQVRGAAVKADLTVGLGLLKAGCLLHPGREYSGDVKLINLGIPLTGDGFPVRRLLDASILHTLPSRSPAGHKGTFGHVLVVGGSRNYAGAPSLSGQAALRGGAGLVTLAVPENIVSRFPPSELIILPLEGTDSGSLARSALAGLLKEGANKDVLVVGPGLSREPESLDLVQHLLRAWDRPAVIDADALEVLTSDFLKSIEPANRSKWILTPHPGEMARLLGNTPAEVNENRLQIAQEFAEKWGLILVLKGAPTIISSGKITYINSTGSHGLASAGTGDVLAGLIGSLAAQGLNPLKAAAAGVYAHGAAGDLAGEKGQRSLIAGDCLHLLPRILL